jgi:hypothetical protein
MRVHPPIEYERFAFGCAIIVALASVSYSAWAKSRGLGGFWEISKVFAPFYAFSLILAAVGFVLRRKRLASIRDNADIVSRLLETN